MILNWKNARWLNNFDLIWNKLPFTDLGSPFHDTCMCIYTHVFSKGFLYSLTLISGYLKNSIPVISGQRLWNRWRIRENEWERWAFKWTVSECVPMWTLSSYGGMSRHMHRLFYSYNTRDFFLFHTQKYVDLFHWTCLYMEDSSVCKWMIHAEGIQKWIFLKKMARLLLRSCELRCLLYVLW